MTQTTRPMLGLVLMAFAIAIFAAVVFLWPTGGAKPGASNSAEPERQATAAMSDTSGSTAAAPATDAAPASSSLPTPVIGEATPVQVSRSDTGLLVANVAAASTTDEEFKRLVDEANYAAAKGGDEEERRYIARLIETQNFEEAERALLAIADRPGGASMFVETDLGRALRAAGRADDAKAFEQRSSQRMLATLERMERLGLGAAAPFVYDITFWRANVYLVKGTPEWRRAYESLARVGASIPGNSMALQAGYVRSLGQWASDTIRRADAAAATSTTPR